jgi:hypothetical protein
MSFFDSIWNGMKSVGSAVAKPITGLISQFAPTVGSMLGQRFGGAGGAQLGSSLGNIVSGLTGGQHGLAEGLSGLGTQAAQHFMPNAPKWAQNSTVGQIGGTAGAKLGDWAAQNLLPKSMQGLAPHLQNFGRNFGQAAQNTFGPKLSPQMAAATMAQLPAAMGNRAGSMVYNRTPQGRAAAAENMQHFAELPGMAGGGYVDPNEIHGAMHTMPYGGYSHGPVMYHEGGFAPGGYMPDYTPTFAYGGYAGGGMMHPHHISLQELVETMPTGGI